MGTRDLWRWWRRGRKALLAAAAVWCVVLGCGVTASFISDGVLGQTGTLTLLGALGMLILPGLTAIAMRFDTRERQRAALEGPGHRSKTARSHPPHRLSLREAPGHRARAAVSRSNPERPQIRQSA